jgi:hypothetical protein
MYVKNLSSRKNVNQSICHFHGNAKMDMWWAVGLEMFFFKFSTIFSNALLLWSRRQLRYSRFYSKNYTIINGIELSYGSTQIHSINRTNKHPFSHSNYFAAMLRCRDIFYVLFPIATFHILLIKILIGLSSLSLEKWCPLFMRQRV